MSNPNSQSAVSTPLTRRAFLRATTVAAAGAALAIDAGPRLLAQARSPFVQQSLDSAAKATLQGKMLRGDVGVVMGAGGNVGVLKSAEGAVVVDSSYSTAAAHLWEQLNALGIRSVPLLVNTHWHFDHTDGNAALHQRGASILAHERTRYWLKQDHTLSIPGAFEAAFTAAPPAALPQQVFTAEHTLHHGAETIRLVHYSAAHTDSDIALFFAHANVVHTGDLFFNGIYPLIDSTTGGRLSGMVDAGHKILAATDADTTFIPGHGPIATRAEYAAFIAMLEGVGHAVDTLKRAGKSADEVVAAHPTQPFDGQWAKGFLDGDKFARVVYAAV